MMMLMIERYITAGLMLLLLFELDLLDETAFDRWIAEVCLLQLLHTLALVVN